LFRFLLNAFLLAAATHTCTLHITHIFTFLNDITLLLCCALLPAESSTLSATPACCQTLLQPAVLTKLGAASLDSLQLPVIIVSTGGQNMTAAKNRVHGSMCICGVQGKARP
jgi:hypothetical protein